MGMCRDLLRGYPSNYDRVPCNQSKRKVKVDCHFYEAHLPVISIRYHWSWIAFAAVAITFAALSRQFEMSIDTNYIDTFCIRSPTTMIFCAISGTYFAIINWRCNAGVIERLNVKMLNRYLMIDATRRTFFITANVYRVIKTLLSKHGKWLDLENSNGFDCCLMVIMIVQFISIKLSMKLNDPWFNRLNIINNIRSHWNFKLNVSWFAYLSGCSFSVAAANVQSAANPNMQI